MTWEKSSAISRTYQYAGNGTRVDRISLIVFSTNRDTKASCMGSEQYAQGHDSGEMWTKGEKLLEYIKWLATQWLLNCFCDW